MLYGIVEITISTGWHETYMTRLVKGRKLEAMQKRVDKACAAWWEYSSEFTPEFTAGTVREITKEEFDVMEKYIREIE